MRWRGAAAAITIVLAGASAHAGAVVDLVPKRAPTRVRTPAWTIRADVAPPAPPAPPAQAKPKPRPPAAALATHGDDPRYELPLPPGVSGPRQLTFRFQLGYGVDQGQVGPQPVIWGGQLLDDSPGHNRNLRVYNFGDAVVGTRGLVVPSLLTYFAAHWFFDQDGRLPESASLPSVYDASGARASVIRSAFAQLDGLEGKWLHPLFIRAGRQFRAGMAITHFDGMTISYDTRPLLASVYFGRRVSLFGPGADPFDPHPARDPGVIGGAEFQLRLAALTDVPISLGVEFFRLAYASDPAGTLDNNFEGTLRVTPSSELLVTVSGRVRASSFAHWRAGVRARLSRSSTLWIDVDDRLAADWLYDFILPADNESNATLADTRDPRRFLNLGPAQSRLRVAARAGTTLLDNLDLLLYGALERQAGEASSFSPSFAEIGAGVDGRLLTGLTAGAETRFRRTARADATGDRLIFGDTGATGEHAYNEVDAHVRYALGARRFVGEIDGYARTSVSETRYEIVPPDQMAAQGTTLDNRGGVRFRVEGFMAARLHLLAEYELAGVPDRSAHELSGLQSVRVMLEGAF